MPGFDRTGPMGQGSQTGRRLGKCNPNTKKEDDTTVADESSFGLGMRRGRGIGRGFWTRRGKGRGFGRGNS